MLLCDTGVLYAALDNRDRNHPSSAALVTSGETVVVPAPVIVEVDWVARARGEAGAITHLLASVIDGSLVVVNLDRGDYARALGLIRQYKDLPLDLVDASVVALAERLEETTIATLDRRHFSAVKPTHCKAFTLVP